jgi:hypothetical protein
MVKGLQQYARNWGTSLLKLPICLVLRLDNFESKVVSCAGIISN